MNTSRINIRGIEVQVIRKEIKNLHLSVHPPEGRVRISAPLHMSDDALRLAVITKLKWIKKQQEHFTEQPRQSPREAVTGESHYFYGRRYRLEVIYEYGRHRVVIKNNKTLQLFVNPGTTRENRMRVINEWYREELKAFIPALLDKWQDRIGVTASAWGVKKMKTRWGSCSIRQKRIWLNLELAKKPPECLEYVLVHELVHLLERRHNERFRTFMDKFLPSWQNSRDILKREPLAHEDWLY